MIDFSGAVGTAKIDRRSFGFVGAKALSDDVSASAAKQSTARENEIASSFYSSQ
jgi:hypothetical protein